MSVGWLEAVLCCVCCEGWAVRCVGAVLCWLTESLSRMSAAPCTISFSVVSRLLSFCEAHRTSQRMQSPPCEQKQTEIGAAVTVWQRLVMSQWLCVRLATDVQRCELSSVAVKAAVVVLDEGLADLHPRLSVGHLGTGPRNSKTELTGRR